MLQTTIDWLLLCDIANASMLFCYCLYVVVKLFIYMRIYSRFEYDKHKIILSCNLTGMLLSLPLVIVGKYYWYVDFCEYIHYRGFFYLYFISAVLPAACYIFTRPDHDCFNCFNRIAPQTYSWFQYPKCEKMLLAYSQDMNRKSMLLEQEQQQLLAVSADVVSNRFSSVLPQRKSTNMPC